MIGAKLELPANSGAVAIEFDLPCGAFESSFRLEDEPGLSIDQLPPGLEVTQQGVPSVPS